jgi:serine/threonine protein kinase
MQLGTIRWIAPECTTTNAMNEKSDIYSLGIVLWEIASRRVPFGDIPTQKIGQEM